MPGRLRFTLAQINPVVGDIAGNMRRILEICEGAQGDLVLLPELALSGYPPEDLVLKPAFMDAIEDAVQDIVERSTGFSAAVLLTAPRRVRDALAKPHGDIVHEEQVQNCALLVYRGEILHVFAKHRMPNYGVFDEKRVFVPGDMPDVFVFEGVRLAVPICEDFWHMDVIAHLATQKPDVIITPNGSPFTIDKHVMRLEKAREVALMTHAPVVYANLVGGQDDLVFDGGSFVTDARGDLLFQLKKFEEDIEIVSLLERQKDIPEPDPLADLYSALKLGLHDYVMKNRFPGVLIGLSGGVDSALAAVIACDALGADKVHCVMLPSRYTSGASLEDARTLAENLGCIYETIPITEALEVFEKTVPGLEQSTLAHENIQPRLRGVILMALSNMSGKMLVSTGNKSEMAAGYATLYGDMCGGFNPLQDVYKTRIYALCRWRNAQGASPLIPDRILTKAPTAELKHGQRDQDTLPPYEVLDDILEKLIEKEMTPFDVAKTDHDPKTVRRVQDMLDRAEYKRRQAPPGVKVTARAFGRDRRYPMTNHFKGEA